MNDTELVRIDERSKRNEGRIKALEQRQDDLDKLVGAIGCIQQEQEHIKADVNEIKSDVKSLAEKPARRWDDAVKIVMTALIGGIVGFILSSIGVV